MKLAIVGVGLIGGSVGLAARERLGAEVSGHDPGEGVLDAALAHGAISRACGSIAEAVEGADAVFVAAPVGALEGAVREVVALAGPECVITDVGSTKRDLVTPLSLAAAAVGADGIIVEVHPQPEEAICDGPQALVADTFGDYVEQVERAAAVAGKVLSSVRA